MAPTLFFILLIQVLILSGNTCNAAAFPNITSVLFFGDSTMDTGNNNYIETILRSNHTPYGEDFPGHNATGRFSNGRLVPDMVATILGIKETIPPFLDPNLPDNELRTGVNFASAGSGYDDITGKEINVIRVSKQAEHLQSYIERLKRVVGEEEAKRLVESAVVVISSGTNDFTFNYYDLHTRQLQFNINGYQNFVLNNLQNFVKELYDNGCRLMVVAGLPPIGCLPIQMTAKLHIFNRKCVEKQNSDAQSYNQKLKSLIPQLQSSLPGSKIIYADIYTPLNDMMNNPQKYGFLETRRGCCGTGFLEAGPLCSRISPVCQNASQYLFWDSVHPTEAAYKHLTQALVLQILGQL